MFWADEIAARAAEAAEASGSGAQVINDSKTPSGTVHVGSLRGPVIHDEIWRALRRAGQAATFRYGVDDLDPMDSQALLTPDAVDRYMGVPLAHVPAPPGSDAASYARHFVGELFLSTFKPLGLDPELYWMSEVYAAGDMDRYIRAALDAAETIRTIYREVGHVEKEPGWLPVSVICSNCGRVGTDGGHRLGRRDRRLRLPPGPRDMGHRLRLLRSGGAVWRGRRSCRSTWTGRRSGRCSGSRSRAAARTSPPPAAPVTDPTRSPARSSAASRR